MRHNTPVTTGRVGKSKPTESREFMARERRRGGGFRVPLLLTLLAALSWFAMAQDTNDEGSVFWIHPKNGTMVTGNELLFEARHDFTQLGTMHLWIGDNIHEVFRNQDRFHMYMFGIQPGWRRARTRVIDEENGGKVLGEAETIFYHADPAEAYQPQKADDLTDKELSDLAELRQVLEAHRGRESDAGALDACVTAFQKAQQEEEKPSRRYRFHLYVLATQFESLLPTDKLFNQPGGDKQCFRHSKDYVMDHLHPNDPYQNFDSKNLIYNPYEHQGYDERMIRILMGLTKPGIIGEVGSWKGGSAILMTKILRDMGRQCDAKIVCIDTWLGTSTDYKMQRHIDAENGHPVVYRQYMHNIIEADATDTVVPFPAPASLAAEYFRHRQDLDKGSYGLDLAFIDANHDYQDVRSDIENYFPLLAPGGMMFGDDYSMFGVTRAVNEFVEKHNLTLRVHTSRMWVLI